MLDRSKAPLFLLYSLVLLPLLLVFAICDTSVFLSLCLHSALSLFLFLSFCEAFSCTRILRLHLLARGSVGRSIAQEIKNIEVDVQRVFVRRPGQPWRGVQEGMP